MVLSSLVGVVLPSVLPSAIIPTPGKAAIGGVWALTLLFFAVKFAGKEGNGRS